MPDLPTTSGLQDAAGETKFCITMRTASVRDLRNNFARVSRWLQAGENVEITKRGVPMYLISALPASKNGQKEPRKKLDLEALRAWKKKVFGKRKFTDSIVLVMREEKEW